MSSNAKKRPGISSDLYIMAQEEIMCNKRSLIRDLNKDLAYMLELREQTEDPEQECLINCIIQDDNNA